MPQLPRQVIGIGLLVIVFPGGYSTPTATAQSLTPVPTVRPGGPRQGQMGQEPGGPYYHPMYLARSADIATIFAPF